MPMRIVTLDGGLVASRSPSLLGEGDLTVASGVEYRKGGASPIKLAGHTQFGPTLGNSGRVLSMAQLRFTNRPSYMVAWTVYPVAQAIVRVAGYWGYLDGPAAGSWYSQLGTGTYFSTIQRIADWVDFVNYNDEYYMLFGGNPDYAGPEVRNVVLGADGALRMLGMMPNTAQPTVATTGGGGTGFTLSSTIDYWIEEQVRDAAGNVVRRNVGTADTVVRLRGAAGTTYKPVITRPALVNADATHWALYGTASGSVYPSGFQIGEAAVAQTTIEDTRTGTGPSAPSGAAYGTLTAVVLGATLTVPRYGTAPRAEFGDVFEASLVTNDADDQTLLRYSLAGDLDHFPSFNSIRIPAREGSKITMIQRLGGTLIVGTSDSLWRILTLPRVEDAGFSIERSADRIVGGFGAIHQRASCTFGAPDTLRLAYLSNSGIYATDGANVVDLSTNIDWQGTVATEHLDGAFLIDNSAKQRLEFYYAPVGSTLFKFTDALKAGYLPATPTRCYHIYYHPSHLRRDGTPKVTGPHAITASAGCPALVGTQRRAYLGTFAVGTQVAAVVQEDTGTAFNFGGVTSTIGVEVASGDLYLAGLGGEAEVKRVMLHTEGGATTEQVATVTLTERREGHPDRAIGHDMTLERAGLVTGYAQAYGVAESVRVTITNSDSLGQFTLNAVALDVEPTAQIGGV